MEQLRLLLESDRLKSVERRTYLHDGSRHENSAEHSWHLALAVILLAEHAGEEFDLSRALQIAVVHDLVEIEAGDTFTYDRVGQIDRKAREERAADQLFGLLPASQNAELRALWDEFERKDSPESRFVTALDRLCPVLLNLSTGGRAWREHNVSREQVEEAVLDDLAAVPALKNLVVLMLQGAQEQGFFGP